LINPQQDLPEAADTQAFSVDVYRGGDKLSPATLTFTDESAEVTTESDPMQINYESIIQCRILYAIRKDELPDPEYKNKTDDDF